MPAEHATITPLRPTTGDRQPVLVVDAIAASLATPRCTESANTQRAYADALHRLAEFVCSRRALADHERLTGSGTRRRDQRSRLHGQLGDPFDV